MLKKLKTKIKLRFRILLRPANNASPEYITLLNKLKRPSRNKEPNKSIRILYGPSFPIYSPSQALDRSLAIALGYQGATIIPVYCDAVQKIECNCYGGDWGGGIDFDVNCQNCRAQSEILWDPFKNNLIKLSSQISDDQRTKISNYVSAKSIEELLELDKEDIPIGQLAKDILVNNFLVASLSLVPNAHELLKVHTSNLLILFQAYSSLLDEVRPDRVITNDSYYGMWAIMEALCKERNIPFYSIYPVTKDRAAFAYNDASMNLNFRRAWKSFTKIPLTSKENQRIERWLIGDRNLVIDTTKPLESTSSDPIVELIDKHKPSIILAANVIWDLAALNKQLIFNDMIEWINQTINWFKDKPSYQLIIKPHPAECAPSIPQTRETVEAGIKSEHVTLPKNVFLLSAKTHISINELASSINTKGFAVHTTTPGYEFAAHGYNTITTARSPYRGYGFTLDPTTKNEYYTELTNVLNSNLPLAPEKVLLARKFLKLYQFHYYLKHNLFADIPPRMSPNYQSLIKNPSDAFGYIVSKIIAGDPIISENSWPPES